MKLIPKTLKGKNKIREAGTDQWRIARSMNNVPCLKGVPGLLIEPLTDDEDLIFNKRRWIRKFNDPDFEYQES